MGNVYSTGYNTDNATPPVMSEPNMGGGRVRMYVDTYTQGASAGTIGDVIIMKNLPAGARIMPGGYLMNSAGAASQTTAVGITGTAAKFLAATSTASAAQTPLLAHLASGAMYETTAPIAVILTNATTAIQASQVFTVFIPYVID